eukprot:jgi/Galph1/5933/GphlegSOOS_G4635.1
MTILKFDYCTLMDERQETASLVTNKGMLILKKMGFEERIGRFGDGPLHPISLKKLSGRQGLGYCSYNRCSFTESINSEFESNIPPVNPSCTYPGMSGSLEVTYL